jgi:hypothetical protein
MKFSFDGTAEELAALVGALASAAGSTDGFVVSKEEEDAIIANHQRLSAKHMNTLRDLDTLRPPSTPETRPVPLPQTLGGSWAPRRPHEPSQGWIAARVIRETLGRDLVAWALWQELLTFWLGAFRRPVPSNYDGEKTARFGRRLADKLADTFNHFGPTLMAPLRALEREYPTSKVGLTTLFEAVLVRPTVPESNAALLRMAAEHFAQVSSAVQMGVLFELEPTYANPSAFVVTREVYERAQGEWAVWAAAYDPDYRAEDYAPGEGGDTSLAGLDAESVEEAVATLRLWWGLPWAPDDGAKVEGAREIAGRPDPLVRLAGGVTSIGAMTLPGGAV